MRPPRLHSHTSHTYALQQRAPSVLIILSTFHPAAFPHASLATSHTDSAFISRHAVCSCVCVANLSEAAEAYSTGTMVQTKKPPAEEKKDQPVYARALAGMVKHVFRGVCVWGGVGGASRKWYGGDGDENEDDENEGKNKGRVCPHERILAGKTKFLANTARTSPASCHLLCVWCLFL
jgi:hypothetical protein